MKKTINIVFTFVFLLLYSSVTVFAEEKIVIKTILKKEKLHRIPTSDMLYVPEKQIIITAANDRDRWNKNDYSLKVWSFTGTKINLKKNLLKDIYQVCTINYSKANDLIAAGLADGRIIILDLDGTIHLEKKFFDDVVTSVCFNKTGTKIIASSQNGEIIELSVKGKIQNKYEHHLGAVFKVQYIKNDTQIISASYDGTIVFFNPSGKLLRTLKDPESKIEKYFTFDYDEDTESLVSSSICLYRKTNLKSYAVKVWKEDNSPKKRINAHSSPVNSIDYNSKNNYILTASIDHTVRIFSIEGHELYRYSHNGESITKALLRNNEIIIFAYDGTLIVQQGL